jgi:hypothetical protein
VIAQAPVSAALRFLELRDQVSAFLATAKVSAVGGLTWQEFGELLLALLRLTTTTLDGMSSLSGPEKKELAIEAVAALFDSVADKAVPVVAWPVWVLLKPAIRSLVLAIAAGALEQLLPIVRAIA